MTLIEKIEKTLTFTYINDNNKLDVYEDLVLNTFSEDKDLDIILESAKSVCDFYNKSDDKENVSNMEVKDILEKL